MRRFLPGLRGLVDTPPLQVSGAGLERKDLVLDGVSAGYSSVTSYGSAWGGSRADAWDLEKVITEGYERSVWTYRCVEMISGHTSRLPFVIGRGFGTAEQETLEGHPLLRVMNKRSNPMERARAFRKRLSALVLLSKRGVFVEVTKTKGGAITRLDLLDPGRCMPIPDRHGDYISHFEFTRRDGMVREIDPARIRWIREPHPTDPFSGVTPLEAAGVSVELDFLSRVYNVSFIKNDARPGGVLGIDADVLSDQEMDRVERKMRPGAYHSGETMVLATGPGGMRYVDMSTKPRDMAYEHASKNSKLEVLAAFGIGESLLGSTEGRTYDNAEAELYSYWTQVMPPHMELIADAFDDDIDDDWGPLHDTSGIEVLQLPRRRDREEARNEVSLGLRSIDEYRPFAGLEPLGTPQTRALWVSPAKAPIPGRPGDAEALGLSPGDKTNPAVLAGHVGDGGGEAAGVVDRALGGGGAPVNGSGPAAAAVARASTVPEATVGDASQVLADAVSEFAGRINGDAAELLAAAEGKALSPDEPAPVDAAADPAAAAALALTVQAALEALYARAANVVVARLESPKFRKGTRFWQPDGPDDTRGGTAVLDAAGVVDEERWVTETVETLYPVVEPAAHSAAVGLLGAFAAGGVLAAGAEAADIDAVAAQIAGPVARAATWAATAWTVQLADLVREAVRVHSVSTSRMSDVIDQVRDVFAGSAAGFARSAGDTVGYQVVAEARHVAAASLAGLPSMDEPTRIVAVWHSMGDERVRPAHQEVSGTGVFVGESFTVAGWPMRFPRDPLAPVGLRAGCRCHLVYRVSGEARLVPPPVNV